MAEIQVHRAGTTVVIDIKAKTIGTRYPGEDKPRETYSWDEDWVTKFRACRFCGGQVSITNFAYAYWKLQQGYCSTECISKEKLQQHACCEKAQPLGCVCAYATTCPEHGDRHFGTHD